LTTVAKGAGIPRIPVVDPAMARAQAAAAQSQRDQQTATNRTLPQLMQGGKMLTAMIKSSAVEVAHGLGRKPTGIIPILTVGCATDLTLEYVSTQTVTVDSATGGSFTFLVF
jgi:hypothetical protein